MKNIFAYLQNIQNLFVLFTFSNHSNIKKYINISQKLVLICYLSKYLATSELIWNVRFPPKKYSHTKIKYLSMNDNINNLTDF